MPGTAAPRVTDRAPSDNRERLLFALAESIREKGLRDVQITDVVRHAHASRRTFYRCFEDKDAAVIALALLNLEASMVYVTAAVDLAASITDKIGQGIDAFLSYVAADPILIMSIRTELPIIGERGVRMHLDSIDRFAGLMVHLLREPDGGADDDELTGLAVMLLTGLDGALSRAAARGEPILDLAGPAKLLFRRAVLPATAGQPTAASPR